MISINKNYTKVPNNLITLNLSLPKLKVMLYLLMWQNAVEIYMSHQKIAFDCNLSLSTVKRALKYLAKENFITIVSGRNEYKTNIYIINIDQIDSSCISMQKDDRMIS